MEANENIPAYVQELNEKFFIARLGSRRGMMVRTRVFMETYDHRLEALTLGDFKKLYMNKLVWVGGREVRLGVAWLKSPHRRQVEKTLYKEHLRNEGLLL